MKSLAILLLALAAVPPADAGLAEDPCRQDGVFVQLGLENNSYCDGECQNNGVTVVLGVAGRYECADGCDQGGVFVYVGDASCGVPGPQICTDDRCTCIVCPRAAVGPEPCGVIDEPVCWTHRLACVYLGGPVERLPAVYVECPTQP